MALCQVNNQGSPPFVFSFPASFVLPSAGEGRGPMTRTRVLADGNGRRHGGPELGYRRRSERNKRGEGVETSRMRATSLVGHLLTVLGRASEVAAALHAAYWRLPRGERSHGWKNNRGSRGGTRERILATKTTADGSSSERREPHSKFGLFVLARCSGEAAVAASPAQAHRYA